MKGTFRGHFDECIKHLADRLLEAYPRGSRYSERGREPMAEFCGVNVHTITGWVLRQSQAPRGVEYIKAVCFLEVNDYEVIEFTKQKENIRNFWRLVGYGLVTAEQATEFLGYSQAQSLFRLITGRSGANEEVMAKVWGLWKSRKDELHKKMEEARIRYRIDFSPNSGHSMDETLPPSEEVSVNTEACPKEGVLKVMEGLVQLLDSGSFQNLSAQDIEKLRPSRSNILRLSAHLSSLSAKLIS